MKPYYERDGITIYHGDCREILPSVQGVDLLCADPPYSFGHAPRRREYHAGDAVIQGLTSAAEKVKKGGSALVMTSASARGFTMAQECCRCLEFKRLLVWCKNYVSSPVAGPWRWDHVPILAFGKVCFGRPMQSAWKVTGGHKQSGVTNHPAEVPLDVAMWMLEPLEWETMLDPFSGSGSFLVAAKMLNKKAIGIDIDESHCELAATRLSQGAFI